MNGGSDCIASLARMCSKNSIVSPRTSAPKSASVFQFSETVKHVGDELQDGVTCICSKENL